MGKSKLRSDKSTPQKQIELKIKIVLAILVGIVLIVACYYGICYFILETTNYFLEHFAGSIIMMLIGVMAILMPLLNGQKLTGENKGDNTMFVVGILLFVCSLVSILISYLS